MKQIKTSPRSCFRGARFVKYLANFCQKSCAATPLSYNSLRIRMVKANITKAFMGFNVFTPYDGEIAEEDYYKAVYSFLRLSSMYYIDSYTPVRRWETGETAVATFTYMDENEIENHPGAMPDVPRIEVPLILSYDKEMQVYIGLQFAENIVTDEQVMAIADSIVLQLT